MSTLALAGRIASCLGPGWIFGSDEDGWGAEATIRGPDGEILRLFDGSESHRQSDHGRLFITADLGPLSGHLPYDMTGQYRITVAVSKSPTAIAADIRRRLLPGYQAARHAARHAKQRSDTIDAAQRQLAAAVAAALDIEHRPRNTEIAFGQLHVGVYGRVRVDRGETHSAFTVYVPPDRTAEFAVLLNSFRHNAHAVQTDNPPRTARTKARRTARRAAPHEHTDS